jgi:hypothetical protein
MSKMASAQFVAETKEEPKEEQQNERTRNE